jgi:hypothetical protein
MISEKTKEKLLKEQLGSVKQIESLDEIGLCARRFSGSRPA